MKLLIKIRLKTTTAFWVDKNFNFLRKNKISDDYLKHIIYFIAEGKGWKYFIVNKKRINRIFKEAYRRSICRPDVLFTLHRTTLWINGYEKKLPRYSVDWNGNYINWDGTPVNLNV